jgi:photosystem II stability/assembly factor-like uncharacterized protein
MRLVIYALVTAVLLAVFAPSGSDHGTDPATIQAQLARSFEAAAPRSPEAAALARDMARVRRKALQTTPRAQDPGAFREALAGIKTAPDGSTYSPDYKMRELEGAMARRAARGLALPWVERGPGNVSGRARAIVVDPNDPTHNTWFVATVGGGIWKTTDGGANWIDKTPQLTTLSTTCLAMCESQPNVMYAGTGMGYGRIVDLEGSGIWKTNDGGETWQQLASTVDGQILTAINRIVVDPANPDIVLVCSNSTYSHLGTKGGERTSGIFRSTDGGISWTQTFDPDPVFGTATDNRVQQIVADPTNFQRLYATVNEVGVIRSLDGGQTWQVSADDFALLGDIGNPPAGDFGLSGVSVRTEIAIAPSDPQRIYAAVERPRGVADLYMSQDGGVSWAIVPDISGDPNWFNAFGQSGAVSYQAGWFDNTIAVHPFDEDVVYVGGVNLYRLDVDPSTIRRSSTVVGWWLNNGTASYVHADHHWIEMIPVDESTGQYWVLVANDGGVGVSKNSGASFTQLTGMGTTQFYGADKFPGTDRYFGGMQDNGTWTSGTNPNSSSNWTFLLGGDGFEVAVNANDPSRMLYGSQFNGIVRSTDGGNSFAQVPEATFPTILGARGAPFITKIANDKTDPDLVFIVGSTGVKRSDDFGLSWTETSLQPNWIGWRPFDNVEISIADPQVVWATSRMDYDPASRRVGGIHVSNDGGLSFTQISSNLPETVFESSGVGTHPTDPATAYLLFSLPGRPKILKTTDLGQTFTDLSGFSAPARISTSANGFPDVAVFSLLVMPFDENVLWAGTEIGIFVSQDGGLSWAFADNGLPAVAVFQMRIVDDEVLVATQGRGIWSVSLPELAGYEPPAVTLAPRLNALLMNPDGYMPVAFDLRSAYDSTQVWVDGSLLTTLTANPAPASDTVNLPVDQAGTVVAQVVAFAEGREYRSAPRSGRAYPVDVAAAYSNDFGNSLRDSEFTGEGYRMSQPAGFLSRALHTFHPYRAGEGAIVQLKRPIRVQPSGATLQFSEVVLVEKGVSTNWTDPNFWDYVIVEGTRDGANWVPLVPGYDSRANAGWSTRYESQRTGDGGSSAPGDSELFVTRTIDLLETFDPGDTIFIRFRLYSDPAVVAWGWAIDDIVIQPEGVRIEDERPAPTLPNLPALAQNAPNPFNPSTEIAWSIPHRSRVDLAVYDLAGRLVKRLVASEVRSPGPYRNEWNGLDDQGRPVASGVYIYRLRTEEFERVRKMTLLK